MHFKIGAMETCLEGGRGGYTYTTVCNLVMI